MALKLSYDNPSFPKDYEFGVPDVGIIKNGSSVTLDEETERLFVASRGTSVKDALKEDKSFKVEGTSELSTSEAKELKEGGAS